jgi:hypothetical protein
MERKLTRQQAMVEVIDGREKGTQLAASLFRGPLSLTGAARDRRCASVFRPAGRPRARSGESNPGVSRRIPSKPIESGPTIVLGWSGRCLRETLSSPDEDAAIGHHPRLAP